MFVQKGVHLCPLTFTCIRLCFLVWPGAFTTSTPTKPHILRYMPGSEQWRISCPIFTRLNLRFQSPTPGLVPLRAAS